MAKKPSPEGPVEHGDEVRDKVTGFTGIAMGKTDWMFGCTRWVVQPQVDKEKKIVDAQSFDEPALEIVRKGVVQRPRINLYGATEVTPEPAATAPGGPLPVPKRPDVKQDRFRQ